MFKNDEVELAGPAPPKQVTTALFDSARLVPYSVAAVRRSKHMSGRISSGDSGDTPGV